MARDTDLMNLMRRIESLEGQVRFLSRLESGGGIVAVKYAEFTGTQSASVVAKGNVAITNLSISHTLANSANKLLLLGQVGAVASSHNYANVGAAFADDGALIGTAESVGSKTATGVFGISSASTGYVTQPRNLSLYYAPGDIASHIYTLRAINVDINTNTVYINRQATESDTGAFGRAASSLILIEIAN